MLNFLAPFHQNTVQSRSAEPIIVKESLSVNANSLLCNQFANQFTTQDSFFITLADTHFTDYSPAQLLSLLLEGFLLHPPLGVTYLMKLRNVLVQPLGLRTAQLGCPVSSLHSSTAPCFFDHKYRVLEQTTQIQYAQVLLGADDKHLRFRSVVGVHARAMGQITFHLDTRVLVNNVWGYGYIKLIHAVHKRYIAPNMLKLAVAHVLGKTHG